MPPEMLAAPVAIFCFLPGDQTTAEVLLPGAAG